ncbi:hypothetical protein VTJ04DRAFT_8267 [Mycothermus thermophilus]|uniref:uncharacterized protein n=1 Tax=Humicola insolens TaxID=85995 RepID=UPI0037435DC8
MSFASPGPSTPTNRCKFYSWNLPPRYLWYEPLVPGCKPKKKARHPPLDVGLLRVSRLVAAEATCQFYSINTFHFCIAESQDTPYECPAGDGFELYPDVNKTTYAWLRTIGSNARFIQQAQVFVIQSLVGHHDYPQYLETLRQLMPNLKYFKLICDFRDVDAWNDFVESGQAPAQAELGLPLTQKDVVSVAQGFIDKLDSQSDFTIAEILVRFWVLPWSQLVAAEAASQMVPYEKCLEEVAAPDVNEADIRW